MPNKTLNKRQGSIQKLRNQVEDLKIKNIYLDRFAQTTLLISDLSKKISAVINLESPNLDAFSKADQDRIPGTWSGGIRMRNVFPLIWS